MHIFKYSPRKGTKAARMPEQIDGKIKEERSQKLIKLSNKNQKEYNKSYVGKETEILWEEEKQGYYQGHTKNYILAKMKIKTNNEEKIQGTHLNKNQDKLENKITKVKCIREESEHILVEM